MTTDKIIFELRCYKKTMGLDRAVARVKRIHHYSMNNEVDKASLIIIKRGF